MGEVYGLDTTGTVSGHESYKLVRWEISAHGYEPAGIRLDEEHRHKLATIARALGGRVSEVVRELIGRASEDTLQRERLRAAADIAALQIEDVPDPDVLARQLAATHEPAGLP